MRRKRGAIQGGGRGKALISCRLSPCTDVLAQTGGTAPRCRWRRWRRGRQASEAPLLSSPLPLPPPAGATSSCCYLPRCRRQLLLCARHRRRPRAGTGVWPRGCWHLSPSWGGSRPQRPGRWASEASREARVTVLPPAADVRYPVCRPPLPILPADLRAPSTARHRHHPGSSCHL